MVVQPNVEWYGSDRSFVLLATAAHQRGWAVVPVVAGEGEASRRLRAAGLRPVITDPGAPRPRIWTTARTLRWVLSQLPMSIVRMTRAARRVDLVHCNTATALGAMLGARLARRQLVVHLRERPERASRSWRLAMYLLRRLATEVIAVSEPIAADARQFGVQPVVIHNGLEFDDTRTEWNEQCVLSVGRINGWKGHEVLVAAAEQLHERGLPVRVRIAGGPFPGEESLADALQTQVDAAGLSRHVELLGYVSDIPSLLRTSSIFVSATTRPEPFGLALVDAMAAGLAPVASAHGGPVDIVRDGRTGVLVPPGDVGALADAIGSLWQDPDRTRRLGSAAAADVRERFSIDRTAAAVGELWTHVLARS